MTSRSRVLAFGILGGALLFAIAPVLAQTPEGVSPGAFDRVSEVEGRCPTFIWGGVSEAQAYELVVYRLPDQQRSSDTGQLALSASDEVLYSKVPGGATAWQPELADGLDPGGAYVWFVRAVLHEEAGEVVETGDWSTARFFSIPAMPSPMEVEEALGVLQRYTELGGAEAADLEQSASQNRSLGSRQSEPRRSSVPPPESLKSVPTATAAIKGTIPDATGETYGVVGVSSSPDGAGVGAANTAGGPDLVLDGSEDFLPDAELSESGIDRPWGTPQTFDITNSTGAGMTLQVDGIEVTTTESELDADNLATGTVPDGRLAGLYSQALSLSNPGNDFTGSGAGLTGVDADTLDGTDGAAFATDAEAVALVAAHAASADHDGRYSTETELATSGASAIHWDNLTAVPAGFADGVDDNTEYSPGPGLIIDGGQIRIDWSLLHTSRSTLDSVGNVGRDTSIAIGADGLGLISYFDQTNADLKVAHCIDTACSSATTTVLDTPAYIGVQPSIAISVDGLGLISYCDQSNGNLKAAHCDDIDCSSATLATLDSTGDVGYYTSIAIGADGLGLISYYDNTIGALKVAHCDDIDCSTATTATLDNSADVGWDTSIAIGVDGLGLISYFDSTNFDLKVAHCIDTACSSATLATLDSGSLIGYFTSIAIGADGFGLISYYDSANDDLKVAHCIDTACSSATLATLDSAGNVGYFTSIAIGADGLGLVSYHDFSNGSLKVARCADTACSSAATATLDSGGNVGQHNSIAIGADGLGLISYFDITNEDLKAAHLGIGVP